MDKKKYNIIVAEDELPIREYILDLISNLREFNVFGTASNGADLEELLQAPEVDLAIIDIDLPVKNTMDVLSDLGTTPPLIFITAYANYAVKAFEIGSLDFIVKPFEDDRFYQAMDRATLFLDNLEKKKKIKQEILWIKDDEKIFAVNIKEILYFKAKDKYTFIYTQSQTYKRCVSLTGLLNSLKRNEFIQTHRSYAINKKKIKFMEPMFNGNYELSLKGTEQSIPVSKKFYNELVKL